MCNAEGSENNLCNVDSGHCYCKPNIGGDNCEKCIDGFFGFPTCQGLFSHYLLNLDGIHHLFVCSIESTGD